MRFFFLIELALWWLYTMKKKNTHTNTQNKVHTDSHFPLIAMISCLIHVSRLLQKSGQKWAELYNLTEMKNG